ncbi:MAG: FtsX-like permease family protein [Alphaproteobacteria bacterium]|nr:FtsX-like permease family protein [Alphaproteobacteria bacterium]MDP6515381.1 FtsX-like permease family protein [Alphaproteobacteria bacterium]
MRALNKKLLRDLWRARAQVVAIGAVVGCGVAVFLMSVGTLRSLDDTRAAYYERYRFADVFAQVRRAPAGLAARVAVIAGVQRVETRIVEDVILDIAGMDEPATARLVSIPERGAPVLNDLTLRQGRRVASDRPDEVVISEAFAEAHGFGPGDHLSATINERKRRLDIVGVALSPEYIYAIGPGVFLPDNRRFGVIWMGREALAAAFDLKGAFNDVSMSLLRSASEPEVIARLDAVLEPFGGVGAHGRDDQVSHAYLDGELEQLSTIATIVPPIFLAVAAFLLNIVLSRLIDAERGQIGLFKAFGYTDRAVAWHYVKFVLVVLVLGIAFGVAGGAWLGRALTEMYTELFRFPFLHYRPGGDVFVAAAVMTLTVGIVGTLGAVRRAARLAPAVAMAPPAPAVYTRAAFEGLIPARLLGQPSRMVLRHILRWPGRAAMTTLGLSLSLAILVSTLFFFDAIDHLIEVYFHHAQRQDVTVTLIEPRSAAATNEMSRLPGVMATEPYRAVAVRLGFGARAERVAITGLRRDADLWRLLDTDLRPQSPPDRGIALSTELARRLGAGRGDRITLEVLEGRRPVRELPVSAVVEEYIATPAYMDLNTLNRLMEEGPLVSGASLLVDSARVGALYRALKEAPAVAGVVLHNAALRTFNETMAETMYIIISFYVGFGGLLAAGTVYNSARIALSERGRELASLRVLGFTRGEVSAVLLGEFMLLTLVALPIGCVIGYGLAWYITAQTATELYRIPLVVAPDTYGMAVGVVIAASAASALLVRRRIDRLDLITVLKTRE